MKILKFTYWKDSEFFLGFLNDYPDYQTQGLSKEELVENLRSLLMDMESGEIRHIRDVDHIADELENMGHSEQHELI
ncbi:MAG: type II toxin-antitoxin system HicB family antitoxin [Candidatus Competibacter sp.]|nr:type II toxin-antitoxin system HicB family antitoxin [Candidatus Competibacter sp.]MDG4606608.1 type II toxin-antitoxin system HicB family antitoxin [Candidatus Contendobacter sp.]HRD50066.1 type II toxin-antitoxin system HicB family antitoxin [Candidatus Contendobacter sp.]